MTVEVKGPLTTRDQSRDTTVPTHTTSCLAFIVCTGINSCAVSLKRNLTNKVSIHMQICDAINICTPDHGKKQRVSTSRMHTPIGNNIYSYDQGEPTPDAIHI